MASTRDTIMEVATDLFIEQGYEGTSLREIAERVGVTKAALYYHFSSKEDLVRALLEPMGEMQEELVKTVPERPTLAEWAGFLDQVIAWLAQNGRTFQLLERNHELFDAMHEEGHAHLQLHRIVEQVVSDETRDVEERILMASALGISFGLAGFGGQMLTAATPDVLTKVLSDAIHRLLDV